MAKQISEQIKEHIEKSGISLYRISLDSGVGHRVLLRFVNEDSDMKISNIDKLADYLAVSYTHLRAHETVLDLVCRLLLEKKKKN